MAESEELLPCAHCDGMLDKAIKIACDERQEQERVTDREKVGEG